MPRFYVIYDVTVFYESCHHRPLRPVFTRWWISLAMRNASPLPVDLFRSVLFPERLSWADRHVYTRDWYLWCRIGTCLWKENRPRQPDRIASSTWQGSHIGNTGCSAVVCSQPALWPADRQWLATPRETSDLVIERTLDRRVILSNIGHGFRIIKSTGEHHHVGIGHLARRWDRVRDTAIIDSRVCLLSVSLRIGEAMLVQSEHNVGSECILNGHIRATRQCA